MSDSGFLHDIKHYVGIKEDAWPIIRLVGHLENISRRDVFSYLKGHIERHFPEHINEHAYVALKRFKGGWLYEVCLGGDGKSRVDEIARFAASAGEDDRLVLPAAHRFGELSVTNSGRISYRLLPEAEHTHHTDLTANKKASSLYPSFNGVLMAGGVTMLVGASMFSITLALSLNANTIDRSLALDRMHQQAALSLAEQYELMPYRQYDESALSRDPERYEYIQALRFDGQTWETRIGCIGDRCETDQEPENE